jgi:hypothetical protein
MTDKQIKTRLINVVNFKDAKDLAAELTNAGHTMGMLMMVVIKEIESQRAQIKSQRAEIKSLLELVQANSKPEAQIQIIGLGTLKR